MTQALAIGVKRDVAASNVYGEPSQEKPGPQFHTPLGYL